MGNVQVPSSSEFGNIQISCDFTTCVINKEYEGKVFLSVLLPLEGYSGDVEIYGVEWTKHLLINSSNFPDREEFVRYKFPLNLPAINGVVQPGNYTFPFSFVLTTKLPNSLPKATFGGMAAAIEYHCIASVYNRKKDLVLQTKSPFNVVNPPVYPENLIVGKSENITGWFRMNKGSSTVTVTIPKACVFFNEPLNLNVDLDCTMCDVAIKSLNCTLYQVTTIPRVKDILNRTSAEKLKLQSWNLQGVEANKKIVLDYTLNVPHSYKGIPLQTIKSQLIKRSYVLEFKPDFDVPLGDRKIKLEVEIAMCPLTPASFLHPDGVAPEGLFIRRDPMQYIPPPVNYQVPPPVNYQIPLPMESRSEIFPHIPAVDPAAMRMSMQIPRVEMDGYGP